jgi:hypothetical protein
MTNDDYLAAARQHFVQIEQRMGIVPDVAVFASWVRFPRRAISDASGRGQDYLPKEYVQFRNARRISHGRAARFEAQTAIKLNPPKSGFSTTPPRNRFFPQRKHALR